MGFLDDAEDEFRDIDALKTRQKYQEALEVQRQRNKSDAFKIWNYDFVVAERDALKKERVNAAEMAMQILDIIFKDLKKNDFDSDKEGTAKYPPWVRTLERLAGEQLRAMANELYKKERKAELENKFKQEYQKQADQIIESARTEASGTQEEKEGSVKNLAQKIQDLYPSDVFKSLQKSWKIWCIECTAFHDHVFTEGDVTTLLRHTSVKKVIENMTYDISRFGIMWPKFEDHVQVIQLADVVRRYIQSRLRGPRKGIGRHRPPQNLYTYFRGRFSNMGP